MALEVAPARLLPTDPFKLRAPATAAASEASWHWLRATASIPKSTDNATNPHNITIAIAVNGRMAPRDIFLQCRLDRAFIVCPLQRATGIDRLAPLSPVFNRSCWEKDFLGLKTSRCHPFDQSCDSL